MNLLQIKTSLFGNDGQSSRLADQFVAARKDARVVVRDLSDFPVPHLDGERFQALLSKPESRTLDQQAVVSYSDALIDELRAADTIVLGLPMYNFGIPSTLKAYFDHIARVGLTFKYTEKGAVGLLTGKKAFVFAARGGYYAGMPSDTQTAYVRHFLGFLGITDIEFVYAEGLAINDASREKALKSASKEIERLNAPQLAAAARRAA